ncbi:MAG: hypothetical protein KGD65_04585 [Candidatus Lokiarchaeota archaeon]|nr:hypothetical protein [Candidatus Lokiarchaeota archaeon]
MSGEKKKDIHKGTRIIVRIIGFSVLIGGIFVLINGIITKNLGDSMFGDFDAPWFETVSRGNGLMFGGIAMIIFSSFLLFVTYRGRIAGYMLDEVSKTTDSQHKSDFERYEKIIEESSKRRVSKGNRAERIAPSSEMNNDQIVKIKCVLCGALNDEDAQFCDQCSEPL